MYFTIFNILSFCEINFTFSEIYHFKPTSTPKMKEISVILLSYDNKNIFSW